MSVLDDLKSSFTTFVDANKQTIGNNVFSSITGAIQGQLTNSGVELQSEVVPIAKEEKQEESPSFSPSKLILFGGVAVIGFLLLRKFKKVRA